MMQWCKDCYDYSFLALFLVSLHQILLIISPLSFHLLLTDVFVHDASQMLIKLRRNAIGELEAHCTSLQERNQRLTQEIEEANQSSFSSVRDSLILHGKLGVSVH